MSQLAQLDARRAQRLAKAAGFFVLASVLVGPFAEVYVPGKLLVDGDAAATARNIAEHTTLFRWSFIAYLCEAISDVAIALLFYLLLRPVDRCFSLLAAGFGLVSMMTFATAELFYFAAGLPAIDSDFGSVLPQADRAMFSYSALTLYEYAGSIFIVFYGIATGLRGYLILRSTYFPQWLGIILMIAGVSFIAKNFVLIVSPQFDYPYLLLPTIVAMVLLSIQLLAQGINEAKWSVDAE